jgi:threonine dehydratase
MQAAIPQTPTLDETRAAAARLAPYIVRTPLLRLNLQDDPRPIYLKLENLQPIGAFKVRPIGNVLLTAAEGRGRSVYTASSGNSGLALAWMARHTGLRARIYAPATAPAAKLDAIRAFGAEIVIVPDEEWWRIIESGGHPEESGVFVDAVRNPRAMAGIATLGLEIVEQLPEVETVIVPFGGGGALCGIASAVSALKPGTRIVAAESSAAQPLTAALREGRPVQVPTAPSFISGIGAPSVLVEMWPIIKGLVHGTAVVSTEDVAKAIRLLFLRNRVVAEGAGAISVAAALADGVASGATVCVVTGGNIDPAVFCRILDGQKA